MYFFYKKHTVIVLMKSTGVCVGEGSVWPWNKLCYDFLANSKLHSAILRTEFVEAGIIELGHLPKASMESLGFITDIRSSGVLRGIVDEFWQSLSMPLRVIAVNRVLNGMMKSTFFPVCCLGVARGE